MRAKLPILALLLATPCCAFAARNTLTRPVKHTTHRTVRAAASKPVTHETAGMAPERASEIQSALIRKGYLTGEPSGHWDAESQAAMQKLQGDNGWQTRITPDSRALIQLGLGPAPLPATPPTELPR